MSDKADVSRKMVYCLICISEDDSEVVHIFSTPEKLQEYAENDDRIHVAYDYVIDHPERMEEPLQ